MNELRQSSEGEGNSRFAFLTRTFASSLGPDSATADCWLWFYGARVRQALQGARKLRRHPACSSACPRLISWHGLPF